MAHPHRGQRPGVNRRLRAPRAHLEFRTDLAGTPLARRTSNMSPFVRSASSVAFAAGLATLIGCAPHYHHYGYHHHHHGHVSTSGAIAVGLIAGVAIASMAREAERPPPPTAVYVYSSPPPVIVAAPAPAAPAPPRADDLPPLDPSATRAAFADVDLSGCNAPRVYGHAKISLNPDGRVSRVVVEDPSDLDPRVAQCIGKKIGQVTVPPFRGGMVVLGTTFRVQG